MNTPFFSSLVSRYPAFSAQNGWKDTEQLRELHCTQPAPRCPQRQHTSCARSREIRAMPSTSTSGPLRFSDSSGV